MQTFERTAPLVSVCVPAYNGERWIRAAIESVLAQTHENFELVISDGGSVDATAAICRSYRDSRIRVDAAPQRLPAIVNWNRSILLSRGEYIKFLHQDDLIHPRCLERMTAPALEDPGVGLVFAPRELILDPLSSEEDHEWAAKYGDMHRRFVGLKRVNNGRDLFRQLLETKFAENWIGEPSSVLVTRRCLAEVGLFNRRLSQVPDLDLWCRAMLRFRVAFVDTTLSTYRHHAFSLTSENKRLARDWLDRLWLLEGLLTENLSTSELAEVRKLRAVTLHAALRGQVGRLLRRRFSSELVDYALYRAKGSVGRATSLHAPLLEPHLKTENELVLR